MTLRPFPLILVLIGAISLGAYGVIMQYKNQPDVVFEFPDNMPSLAVTGSGSSSSQTTSASGSISSSPDPRSPVSGLPSSVLIKVPFASQAPLLNWDALHEEACEEASLILVDRYLKKQTISPEEMEAEIQKLVAWETDQGYGYDVTIDELKRIAADFYQLKGTVITEVTVERMKKELAAGHPIIIPAAGQTLGNPYFSGDGPPYHMLVVIGYNSSQFITNDVGTRRGKEYKYDYQTLLNAIHDWNGSTQTITTGRKAMMVLTTQS